MAWNSRSLEDVENIVNDLGYILLDTYFPKTFGKSRKVIIQDECGYKYDVLMSSLVDKNRSINKFDKSNKFSLENIKIWLKINHKDFELCNDNEYVGINEKLKFYHPFCDEYFYMSCHQVQIGHNCSVCRGYQVGVKTSLAYLRPDLVKEFLYSEHNKSPEELTEHAGESVYWKCSTCGHEWWASVDHRSQGRGCFDCAQEQIESFVATECKQYFYNNYSATPEYKLFKNPKTNQWLRCDIYIPNNIFVEIHGGQHYIFTKKWHKNQEGFEYKKYLDKIKKEYCQENGLYIEIDLRKIKTTEDAIKYIESILELELSQYVY